MLFGQLTFDFQPPVLFGKCSSRPSDPLGLVLPLRKPFQRCDESSGRLGDSIVFHGHRQTVGDVDEGLWHWAFGFQRSFFSRSRYQPKVGRRSCPIAVGREALWWSR